MITIPVDPHSIFNRSFSPPIGVYYTPTPVYEILMNLTIFAVLWSLRKKGFKDGILTLIYLALYSFARFFIAFTSAYQIIALGMNQAQLISIIVFTISLPLLIIAFLKRQQLSVNA